MKKCAACQTQIDKLKSYCDECRPFAKKVGAACSIAMRSHGLNAPTGATCKDCGQPATIWDHRHYASPTNVDPVCRACNKARGPADDIASMVAQLRKYGYVPPQITLSASDGWIEKELNEMEWHYITEALTESRWNRTKAAHLLGITFRALRYRMERLSIS